jgi:hypothetical protein
MLTSLRRLLLIEREEQTRQREGVGGRTGWRGPRSCIRHPRIKGLDILYSYY